MEHDYLELTERLERAYSPRIALRRVSLSDGWPLFEATRNPLFNKHLLWDPPESELEVLRRIDVIVEACRRGQLAAVSGVARTTGEWASLFRFQPYAADPSVMEMGVWTHDRFWTGRYTLELSHMCVDAVFQNSDVKRLVGAASPDNRGSCALMKSVGLKETQVVARRTETGRVVELQEFELLRAEWDACAEARAEKPSHSMVPTAPSVPLPSRRAQVLARRRARDADMDLDDELVGIDAD
jgi:RimJ/RimL family protein N-acetyltransferase